MEQGAGGLDAGGRINRVSHEEDDGADDLEGMGLGLEAVGQILGNGDGVIRRDGEGPQARRLEDPAEGIADGQADCDPDLTQTQGIDGSRKAHQHPGAHIGSAGGQRGDPGPHFAPAEEVFLFTAVLRTEEEEDTDADHEEEIDNKDDQFCCVVHCNNHHFPMHFLHEYCIQVDIICGKVIVIKYENGAAVHTEKRNRVKNRFRFGDAVEFRFVYLPETFFSPRVFMTFFSS